MNNKLVENNVMIMRTLLALLLATVSGPCQIIKASTNTASYPIQSYRTIVVRTFNRFLHTMYTQVLMKVPNILLFLTAMLTAYISTNAMSKRLQPSLEQVTIPPLPSSSFTPQSAIPITKKSSTWVSVLHKSVSGAAIGAVAAFCSGQILGRLRHRTSTQQISCQFLPQEASLPNEGAAGPLYPTEIPLIASLPNHIQQLLVSFVAGPFKKVYEHPASQGTLDPDTIPPDMCLHKNTTNHDLHLLDTFTFIDDDNIKFLTYYEMPKFTPQPNEKPTTTFCSCTQLYIGPDTQEKKSYTTQPCKTHLPNFDPMSTVPIPDHLPIPQRAPEEFRVSIDNGMMGDHREAINGDLAYRDHGIRRVFDSQPALWFIPFKNLLAIYQEIPEGAKRHQRIDDKTYPRPPSIPAIIYSRDKSPHQLIQLIQEPHDIQELAIPLVHGSYPKRKRIATQKEEEEYEAQPDEYETHFQEVWYTNKEHERKCRQIPRKAKIEKKSLSPLAVARSHNDVTTFAFSFDRLKKISSLELGRIENWERFTGLKTITGPALQQYRCFTVPPHIANTPDKQGRFSIRLQPETIYMEREAIECIVFKKRINDTDYDIAELFQQVVPPRVPPRPPLPALTQVQKFRTLFTSPPKEEQEERLEVIFDNVNRFYRRK